MELDITGIKRNPVHNTKPEKNIYPEHKIKKTIKPDIELKKVDIDVERCLKDILKFTDIFNKRLKFSFNRALNQMIVKVIDKETDKVIKEIPPEELQRLHIRMKETLGILFDEKI